MPVANIQMVDLVSQYHRWKEEIDSAVSSVIESGAFINGPHVKEFASNLAAYLRAPHVIPCGNGTDALQISLMCSGLHPGDEVIVPAFTYAAAAEAAVLLGLVPVPADVDPYTYNIMPESAEAVISERTRAIIPVHLFGQTCDMHPLLALARKYDLFVIEDNAQSLGSAYSFPGGETIQAGVMGDIGTLSFFPTKTLGCFGDGGAIITRSPEMAEHIRKTTVHGQSSKYHHEIIGVNSRLDTLHAAILDIKLRHIDESIAARQSVATFYNRALAGIPDIILPRRLPTSTHIYNQYTIRVLGRKRDSLQAYLKTLGVPSIIYYPLSLDEQKAFAPHLRIRTTLNNSRLLAREVLSLPIHTEMKEDELRYIVEGIRAFFTTI